MTTAMLPRRKGLKPVEQCSCIIAVSDKLYLQYLRQMLFNLNFCKINISADGANTIFLLNQMVDIDLVIAQEDLPIADCLEVLRFVRLDRKWQRPDLPVISVGWKWTREKIAAYRDAGVNDIVVFPTSQYTMQRRIFSALYSERPFISDEAYHGPDRRRLDVPGYQGPFRRGDDKPAPPSGGGDPPPLKVASQAELQKQLSATKEDKDRP